MPEGRINAGTAGHDGTAPAHAGSSPAPSLHGFSPKLQSMLYERSGDVQRRVRQSGTRGTVRGEGRGQGFGSRRSTSPESGDRELSIRPPSSRPSCPMA